MRKLSIPLAIAGMLVTTALACSLAGRSNVPSATADEQARAARSAAETAAALADPQRAEEGVWSLLANLGIGVYSAQGEQVAPGSETRPEDFWLYDFEVGYLTRMAGQAQRPFAEYHALLADLGYDGDQADLLLAYRRVYAEQPDAFLSQYFQAAGLRFEGDPGLTPLQSWLLLLDTFVPPNGEPAALRGGGLLARRLPQGGPCGTISGGTVVPAWGLARSASDIAALIQAETAYYAIHGPMLASSYEARLEPSARRVHEWHEDPVEPLVFTFSVEMNYIPQSIPVAAVNCGYLLNLDPPIVGGVEGVQVWWEVEGPFEQHGRLKTHDGSSLGGPARTDGLGRAELAFEPRAEPARGQGEERTAAASVAATYDVKYALQTRYGLNDPRLLMFLPERGRVLFPAEVEIGWHELDWRLTMDMTMEAVNGEMRFQWEGAFSVDDRGALKGAGTGTLSGVGRCQVVENGVVTYVGPDINVSGDATFEIRGRREGREGAYRFRLEGRPGEGDVTFTPSEDEMCGPLMFEMGQSILQFILANPLGMAMSESGTVIDAQDGATMEVEIPDLGLLYLVLEKGSSRD